MGEAEAEPMRRDLERLWDQKLHSARQRYFSAAAEFHRNALRDREPPGDLAQAARMRRTEARAFAEYCRVLATFTELVVVGILPGSEPSGNDPQNSA